MRWTLNLGAEEGDNGVLAEYGIHYSFDGLEGLALRV
jgi:hypothetical protein